ncbi:MAG: aminotransferase class I/II-fold pyridoxal phosphate-dependent enzyme [Oscillospiraceae bacterium]|nr:aminotransferase class I/II-fold pyridoxal phosphate-dependent enzyme [Oscillospiraceae bacterium]
MTARFLGKQAAALSPYTPGEQPQDRGYIKLNTNECPFPPSPAVKIALEGIDERLRLYPDPECGRLKNAFAAAYGVEASRVFVSNGSDETLAFAFMAFFDRGDTVCLPDLSYGFYPVYAALCGLNAREIPLREDYSINPGDWHRAPGHILIANPNAPTGLSLKRDDIESILISNPERLVMIDEAYIDFAEEGVCALPLLERHANLMVIGTLSKSRSLAGMRIGFAISSPEIIAGLDRIKYSFNPYNLSCAAQAAGEAALGDKAYLLRVTAAVKQTRERSAGALSGMGLKVLKSGANFFMASRPGLSGRELYLALKARGILVRCFEHPRMAQYVRISIGTDDDMNALIAAVKEIIREGSPRQ